MTQDIHDPRNFGGPTTWQQWNKDDGVQGWATPGWAMPSDPSRYIGKDDPAWTMALFNAQSLYGDPKIHFNTDDTTQERYLAFGDGTRLPTDGTVVYHDSASGKNWIQNKDGSVTPAGKDFKPTGVSIPPAGFRNDGKGMYAPIDAHGNQIGALGNGQPQLPPGATGWHDANGTITPINANGDYYEVDPTTGQHKYFDKNGKPTTKDKYFGGAQPQTPAGQAPLQSTKVTVPDGMTTPEYPQWATDVDPDVPNQMTGVVVRLFELFGSGTPTTSDLPEFPFSTDTGEKSGIDAYDKVKGDFKRIESQFDSAAKAFKDAVQNSANVTKAGRDAINNAVSTFNTTAKSLEDGDWDGLLQAESTMLDTVKSKVESAATTQQNVPSNPAGGPGSPAAPADPAASAMPPGAADPSLAAPPADSPKDLKDLLDGMGGSPFGGGMPMGGNPLGALGGMNPMGGGGGPMGGGGGNPLSPLADAVKPLSKLADAESGKDDDKKAPIAPLNSGPQNAPPPPAASPAGAPADPAAVVAAPGQPGPAKEPAAAPVGNSTTPGAKPTVTLPDGKVVEAPNKQAADAAQNALDKASPGGDAAQKAYSPAGLDLPGDGKNLGAKVDPSDMQPGDVLKWQDKTMVAVAPGLVADPNEPGVTHTLAEVFKDQKGFEGVFRPTETDPTLSTHTTAPPLADPAPAHAPGQPAPPPPAHDQTPAAPAPQAPPPGNVPAEPPPDSVPLSGPGPAGAPAPPQQPPQQPAPQPSSTVPQAAPPSPFESAAPPPATRSTKTERIAAGLE